MLSSKSISLFTHSGSDSITLNYTQKGNCTEETFTCRLKDLPQLQNYIYSYNSVTVRTSLESEPSVSHSLQLQSALGCCTVALFIQSSRLFFGSFHT